MLLVGVTAVVAELRRGGAFVGEATARARIVLCGENRRFACWQQIGDRDQAIEAVPLKALALADHRRRCVAGQRLGVLDLVAIGIVPILALHDAGDARDVGAGLSQAAMGVQIEDAQFYGGAAQAVQNARNSGSTRLEATGSVAGTTAANMVTLGGYNSYQAYQAYQRGEISLEQLDQTLSRGAGNAVGAVGVGSANARSSGAGYTGRVAATDAAAGEGSAVRPATNNPEAQPVDAAIAKARSGCGGDCEHAAMILEDSLGSGASSRPIGGQGVLHQVVDFAGEVLDPTASQYVKSGMWTPKDLKAAGMSKAVETGRFTPEQHSTFMDKVQKVSEASKDEN